jgi:predicted nuclease of restriction endonuclease-like (RecB) superfamily
MICLYWNIGREILDKQERHGWGSKIIDNLSADLLRSFPNMKGLSVRNLKYMRQFAEVYPNFEIVQRVSAQLGWWQNIDLMQIKDAGQREFYTKKALENGWSRNILNLHVESDLYSRQLSNSDGKTANFELTMPKEDSDSAAEILKDRYRFQFLDSSEEASELEIERGLVSCIRNFLLELGTGFEFVGEQYHLEVGGQDFYMDLLFYNLKLRCFVIIELKAGDFKPEYAGKLNFYVSAADDILRHRDDKPTIGLLLCRKKNKKIAEYSLARVSSPICVAEYIVAKEMEKEAKGILPSIEQLEAELNRQTS